MFEQPLRPNIICSLTGKVFRNPVVASNGQCYEKHALKESELNLVYFQNKQLLEYINALEQIDCDVMKNRYVCPTRHADNKEKIKNIIVNKKFNNLLNYNNFDLELLMNTMYDGQSLLKLICTECSDEIIQYVIDNIINIHFRKIDNGDILGYIIYYCSSNILDYFLSNYDFDIYQKTDIMNRTYLHKVLNTDKHTKEKLKIIIKHSNLQLQKFEYLQKSMNNKDYDFFLQLYKNAFFNNIDCAGKTVLDTELQNPRENIVKILVEAGCYVTVSHLEQSVNKKNYKIFKFLFKNYKEKNNINNLNLKYFKQIIEKNFSGYELTRWKLIVV